MCIAATVASGEEYEAHMMRLVVTLTIVDVSNKWDFHIIFISLIVDINQVMTII